MKRFLWLMGGILMGGNIVISVIKDNIQTGSIAGRTFLACFIPFIIVLYICVQYADEVPDKVSTKKEQITKHRTGNFDIKI